MKKGLFFLLGTIFIVSSIILAISMISLRRIILKSDRMIRGEKVSVIAQRIRKDLFDKYDIEKVRFDSERDLILNGFFIKRKNPKGNVILCHGFHRSKEFVSQFIDFFDNYNILMFDFRAQGDSGGDMITLGLAEGADVIAAAKFIKSKTERLPLVIVGSSMGGAAALNAAYKQKDLCDALIVDSVFKTLSKAVKRSFSSHSGLPNFPFVPTVTFLAKKIYNYDINSFKVVDFIKDIKIPIFFVHSAEDFVVPPSHSVALYAEACKAGRKAKLWISPPVRHANTSKHYPEEYKARIQAFLREVI